MRIEQLQPQHIDIICELWNKELGGDFPMRSRLMRQNGPEHPDFLTDGSWVALEEQTGVAVGFVICKKPAAGVGRISALLVDRGYRGQGLGSRLLALARQALTGYGAQSIALGGDSGHFFPGVPSSFIDFAGWLERRGFMRGAVSHDMLGDFKKTMHPPLLRTGDSDLTVHVSVQSDREELLAFMHAHFPGRWAETTERYFTLGGTGREFVLLRLAGDLIGFCRVNDDASPVLAGNQFWSSCFAEPCAGIGPLGIAAPYRGRGYGLAALAAGVRVLWERGIRLMVIDWTTAVDFYGKAGFTVWKSYIEYRREG